MSDHFTITVYGIANCDSVKKTRAWLDEQHLPYTFHDFKKQGADTALIAHWLQYLDWQILLNTRGTTWRQLDAATRAAVCDATSATACMSQHPSLIKRPVIDWGNDLLTVGLPAAQQALQSVLENNKI